MPWCDIFESLLKFKAYLHFYFLKFVFINMCFFQHTDFFKDTIFNNQTFEYRPFFLYKP